MSVSLSEYIPPSHLQPYIERYWEGKFNTSGGQLLSQRVVPNGYVELIIHLSDLHCDLYKDNQWSQSPDYTIIGVHTQPYEVKFSDLVDVFGVRFKPEGFYNIFGVPASKFKASYEDMESIVGRNFSLFCEQMKNTITTYQPFYPQDSKISIANNYLTHNLEKHKIEFNYLNRAGEIIRQTNGFIRMEELADRAYISMRQLERAFIEKIGITPKFYTRLARLNEVNRQLAQHGKIDFTKISYHCGYSDQAHFIREFKKFTGAIPKVFVKDQGQYIVNPHVALHVTE